MNAIEKTLGLSIVSIYFLILLLIESNVIFPLVLEVFTVEEQADGTRIVTLSDYTHTYKYTADTGEDFSEGDIIGGLIFTWGTETPDDDEMIAYKKADFAFRRYSMGWTPGT